MKAQNMGGMGSGNWFRWQGKKTTVEECYTLDANLLMRMGILRAAVIRSGTLVWGDARTGKKRASIGYHVRTDSGGAGTLRLHYTQRRKHAMDYSIDLQTTRPPYGGFRWWFTCPLVARGRECGRRVARLHLRGKYFGCRHCYGLTYQSSQEAHRDERLASMLDRMIRMGPLPKISTATPGQLLTMLRIMDYEDRLYLS
jgi:hypothetical protein